MKQREQSHACMSSAESRHQSAESQLVFTLKHLKFYEIA